MTGRAPAASLLVSLLSSACASAPQTTPANGDDANRAEILDTVDAFFLALATADADTIAELYSPDAVNVIAEPEKGAGVRYRPGSVMIERMRRGEFPKYRERYWDPIVLERGGLAVVWTPYSIDEGGARLHCGVDIFNLSKHGENWKIDSLNFTMEPSACDEIDPGENSNVRPDFNILDAKEK